MFQSVVKEFSLQSHRFVHGFQYAGETPAEGWKRGNYPGLCEKLLAKSQTLVSVSHGLGILCLSTVNLWVWAMPLGIWYSQWGVMAADHCHLRYFYGLTLVHGIGKAMTTLILACVLVWLELMQCLPWKFLMFGFLCILMDMSIYKYWIKSSFFLLLIHVPDFWNRLASM